MDNKHENEAALPLKEIIISGLITGEDVIIVRSADGRCIAYGYWYTDPVLHAIIDHAAAPATLTRTGPGTVEVRLVEEATS